MTKFIIACLLTVLLSGCEDGIPPEQIYNHSGLGIAAAALSEDGTQALVSTVDLGVQFWDLKQNKIKFQFSHGNRDDNIIAMAFANEAPIAVTLNTNSLVVWDLSTGRDFRYLALNAQPTSLALSSTGKYALIGFTDYTAQLIDLTQGSILRSFEHADIVNAVVLSSNGQYAIIGSADTAVRVWDLNTGRMRYQWFHPGKVTHLQLAENNRYLLNVSSQEKTWVHDLEDGKLVSELDPTPAIPLFRKSPPAVTASVFSKNGEILVTGHPPKMIRVWDVAKGKLKKEYTIPQPTGMKPKSSLILAITLSEDEQYIICETSNGNGYRFAM